MTEDMGIELNKEVLIERMRGFLDPTSGDPAFRVLLRVMDNTLAANVRAMTSLKEERDAARAACRLALNAFEKNWCIDWEIVRANATKEESNGSCRPEAEEGRADKADRQHPEPDEP